MQGYQEGLGLNQHYVGVSITEPECSGAADRSAAITGLFS